MLNANATLIYKVDTLKKKKKKKKKERDRKKGKKQINGIRFVPRHQKGSPSQALRKQ